MGTLGDDLQRDIILLTNRIAIESTYVLRASIIEKLSTHTAAFED